MSFFGIGRRYYRPFRYSIVKSTRNLMRRIYGKRIANRGYKRYYLGRNNSGF